MPAGQLLRSCDTDPLRNGADDVGVLALRLVIDCVLIAVAFCTGRYSNMITWHALKIASIILVTMCLYFGAAYFLVLLLI